MTDYTKHIAALQLAAAEAEIERWKELCAVRSNTAAHKENERLKEELENEREAVRHLLRNIEADKAEIERLRTELESWTKAHEFLRVLCSSAQRKAESEIVDRRNTETKLANLRAAAESVARDWRKPLGGHQVALAAAIEASR